MSEQIVDEGILADAKYKLGGKHPKSGMTDKEGERFMKERNVKLSKAGSNVGFEYDKKDGSRGYEEHAAYGKENYDGVKLTPKTAMHNHIIPQIKWDDEPIKKSTGMSEQTIELIDAISSGDTIASSQHFGAALMSKISNLIDSRRHEVAQNMFENKQIER